MAAPQRTALGKGHVGAEDRVGLEEREKEGVGVAVRVGVRVAEVVRVTDALGVGVDEGGAHEPDTTLQVRPLLQDGEDDTTVSVAEPEAPFWNDEPPLV